VTQQAPGSRFGAGRDAYPLFVLASGELDRNPPARPGPVSSSDITALSEHAEDELVHFRRRARP
jgi:hypothetical protein